MTKALLPRPDYPSLAEWVYLNQASLGLVGEPAVQAMHHFLNNVARHGNLNMTDDDEVLFFESLRQRGARILNCAPDQLAILGSASELLGQLPFMFRPKAGSHILAVASDFPAITRPWLRYCAENDCSLRFIDDVAQAHLTLDYAYWGENGRYRHVSNSPPVRLLMCHAYAKPPNESVPSSLLTSLKPLDG